MKPRDIVDLVLLAALWGASFLFIRIAVPSLGPLPLIELRMAIGAATLLPLLFLRSGFADMRAAMPPIFVVGMINSALPFAFLAFASISLTAGFVSILNASSPLFAAIVAYLWLKDRLSPLRIAGLVIGFLGVTILVWGKVSFKPDGSGVAIVAALFASFLYGIAANYTRKKLTGIDPLAIATGSQLYAAIATLPFALWAWPAALPGPGIWLIVIALGIGGTGIAYVLYFRLIANAGPAKAITVTFLVPVFGVLWGVLFLDEMPTLNMLAGCAVILLGTGLTTGLLKMGGLAAAKLKTQTR